MTAEQEIKAEIIRDAISRGELLHEGEVTADNCDDLYQTMVDRGLHWDYMHEFRESGENTGLPCDFSRHYESDAVGCKLSNGKWVGWTYWHGGGKHGEPEAIEWMEHAYFLDVTEEEKMVVVRTFAKKEEPQ